MSPEKWARNLVQRVSGQETIGLNGCVDSGIQRSFDGTDHGAIADLDRAQLNFCECKLTLMTTSRQLKGLRIKTKCLGKKEFLMNRIEVNREIRALIGHNDFRLDITSMPANNRS